MTDNAEKRRSAVGTNFIAGPGVTPNTLKDSEWRQQAGYGYSGITVLVGFIVIDVDTDESIADAQEGVIVTIDGTVSASGKTVWLEQSGTWVEQTVTAQDASSCTITVTYGSLTPGAANLYVRNPL